MVAVHHCCRSSDDCPHPSEWVCLRLRAVLGVHAPARMLLLVEQAHWTPVQGMVNSVETHQQREGTAAVIVDGT